MDDSYDPGWTLSLVAISVEVVTGRGELLGLPLSELPTLRYKVRLDEQRLEFSTGECLEWLPWHRDGREHGRLEIVTAGPEGGVGFVQYSLCDSSKFEESCIHIVIFVNEAQRAALLATALGSRIPARFDIGVKGLKTGTPDTLKWDIGSSKRLEVVGAYFSTPLANFPLNPSGAVEKTVLPSQEQLDSLIDRVDALRSELTRRTVALLWAIIIIGVVLFIVRQ